MRVILLVDGDSLAHIAVKARNDTIYNQQFREFTKEEDQEYHRENCKNVVNHIKELKTVLSGDEVRIALTDNPTFRHKLYDKYKSNRQITWRTRFVNGVKNFLIRYYNAKKEDGLEADDLLRIWHDQCYHVGAHAIICANDKDMLMVPGRHWDLKKNEEILVDKKMAMHNYYMQMLTGDSTDCIPGIPKVGPVKAGKMLLECEKESDYMFEIMNAYIGYAGDKWLEYLELMGQLITIKPTRDYVFSSDPYLAMYRRVEKAKKKSSTKDDE